MQCAATLSNILGQDRTKIFDSFQNLAHFHIYLKNWEFFHISHSFFFVEKVHILPKIKNKIFTVPVRNQGPVE